MYRKDPKGFLVDVEWYDFRYSTELPCGGLDSYKDPNQPKTQAWS